jgi:hypothetical protein
MGGGGGGLRGEGGTIEGGIKWAPTLEETGKCDTWAAVRVIPGRVPGGGTGQP